MFSESLPPGEEIRWLYLLRDLKACYGDCPAKKKEGSGDESIEQVSNNVLETEAG